MINHKNTQRNCRASNAKQEEDSDIPEERATRRERGMWNCTDRDGDARLFALIYRSSISSYLTPPLIPPFAFLLFFFKSKIENLFPSIWFPFYNLSSRSVFNIFFFDILNLTWCLLFPNANSNILIIFSSYSSSNNIVLKFPRNNFNSTLLVCSIFIWNKC